MSGPLSNPFMFKSAATAAGFYTHQIANSVRVENSSANSTATNYFYRDGDAGNRDTWTLGMWIKRARISTSDSHTSMSTWGGHSGSGSARGYGMVNDYTGTINGMSFENNNGSSWHLTTRTSAMYRDLSAWTHVCWRYDSTQGTDTNRARMYVNGEVITDLQSTTYPAQNADHSWNSGGYQFIGTNLTASNGNNPHQGFDGYIAEVISIDGTSLDPMDNLVETKNGVIIPKDPSGLTFGTNGFWLKFTNSSALGEDFSGNDNDFTVAGIAAHDQMKDSPTFGSQGSANFPIINMLDPTVDASAISEGNLKITEGNQRGGKATFAVPLTGKWYWEAYCYADTAQEMWNGITGITTDSSGDGRGGSSNSNTYGASWSQYSGSNYYIRKYIAGTESSESGSFGTTKHTILGIAINRDDNEAKFYKDNALQFTATISATQEYFPAGGMGGGTNATTIQVWNFGQDGTFAGEKTAQGNADGNGYGNFYYSPPTDHLALCSANLPVVAEVDPAQTDDNYPQKLFNPVLYTGNGSSQSVTGVGFQPDFVWLKNRNSTQGHKLFDSSRGVTKVLSSHNTDEETTESGLSAFDSNGFSLGGSTVAGYNTSSNTYVAWNWRANGGTTSTNNNGSVSSTVQADPSGSFSIVKFVGGISSAGTETIGHGLNKAPSFIINFCYDDLDGGDGNRWTRADGLTNWNYVLKLNATDGQIDKSGNGNMSAPTSTVFSINNTDILGAGSQKIISYCFANCEGYIKVGSYNGNGASSDGTFVYTGFRPAFVMGKGVVSGAAWWIQDNATSPYNPSSGVLEPNAASATYTSANPNVDFLSNGFKVRNNNAMFNSTSYDPYVFLAVAHNPLKYATAR